MTPVQYVVCEGRQLPPKELMYPNWEKEIFQFNGEDILLANFYIICNRAPAPKCL